MSLKYTLFKENAKSLSPSNFTKFKTSSQAASKNYAKILIYVAVYISLNSALGATKISGKPQGLT